MTDLLSGTNNGNETQILVGGDNNTEEPAALIGDSQQQPFQPPSWLRPDTVAHFRDFVARSVPTSAVTTERTHSSSTTSTPSPCVSISSVEESQSTRNLSFPNLPGSHRYQPLRNNPNPKPVNFSCPGLQHFGPKGKCNICMNRSHNTRLPCGHTLICKKCAKIVMASANPICPHCREPFTYFYVNKEFALHNDYHGKVPERILKQSKIVRADYPRLTTQSLPQNGIPEFELLSQGASSFPGTPRLYPVYLFLLIGLAMIFQVFVFLNCADPKECVSSSVTFIDGSSCQNMCCCTQLFSNQQQQSLPEQCTTSPNTSENSDSWTQLCLFNHGSAYNQTMAFNSPNCWTHPETNIDCMLSPSGYVMFGGCALLVGVLVGILIKTCVCGEESTLSLSLPSSISTTASSFSIPLPNVLGESQYDPNPFSFSSPLPARSVALTGNLFSEQEFQLQEQRRQSHVHP
eukprot:c11211_g1_i1.p1 GENE.c11211_g1_i1~~c11211_g1_i1.p1  ORF type:complete len:475 (-),score=71.10 c11211_g1_i1:176-1558(-)